MMHKILMEISVLEVESTAKTKHYDGSLNKEFSKPSLLQIAQYDNDTGFYLFYLNSVNEIMTDTYHETLEDAIDQAEWEFKIDSNKWKRF
jgi:hypothetical protein